MQPEDILSFDSCGISRSFRESCLKGPWQEIVCVLLAGEEIDGFVSLFSSVLVKVLVSGSRCAKEAGGMQGCDALT